MLVVSVASAEEVQVTGYGLNYNSALENAKVMALEKGASTFIIGESTARNGKMTEEIDQYNGGVIKKYDVVSQRTTNMGYEVTIVADVVPKNNAVRKTKTPFNVDFEEYEKREKIVNRLDNVGKAIHAQVTKTGTKIGRYETTVYGQVVLTWQPKWITDMKSLTSVINERGTTTNNVYDNVAGSGINSLMSRFGFLGAMGGMAVDSAIRPTPQQNSDHMMVCFGEYYGNGVDCHKLSVDMTFPRSPKLVLVAKVEGRGHVVLYEQYLDMKMYKYVSSGDTMSTSNLFKSYKTSFHNPALLVYEQQTQVIDLTFNIENSIIKSVTEIGVYLK
jgi:hypothetical protein